MNTASPFPWTGQSSAEIAGTGFRSIFEHAPVAAARCNPQGTIVEMNRAFEHSLVPLTDHRSLRLCDLVAPENHTTTESLLAELCNATRDSFQIQGTKAGSPLVQRTYTAWRLPQPGKDQSHALLIAEPSRDSLPPAESTAVEEGLLQAQRWEAVGRLTGGVVHDFNNLLTGVMLYCDLLLSSLDARDRRRRYADEIRSAIMQATGLVRQLLVFARPQASQVRALCLNQIAQAMRDLLSRLIGDNIVLDLELDPNLGLVKIDQAQAQQILLNLVLNARDALPAGGRIVVETSNCKFQSIPGSMALKGAGAFPCVLLTVGDNGRGMDSKTRQHLFDPFFTTKSAGKGTGLGLTTVRSIVTTNGGLIHVESEAGHGTRVMILLPRAPRSTVTADFIEIPMTRSETRSETPQKPFQEIKKESLL
ncbi:MAG: ATP-binding protein [Candidatus Sulfotelmatobacter sp.]